MKIVHIQTTKTIKRSKKEIEESLKELKENRLINPFEYKTIDLKEPIYIVELSMKELQLISFYLELENRKPIMNVEIDTKIKGEK